MAVAVAAIAAAWLAAQPGQAAVQLSPDDVKLAREWSQDHTAFRRQLGDTPDAAWLLAQPDLAAALAAATDDDGLPLRDAWAAALRRACGTRTRVPAQLG